MIENPYKYQVSIIIVNYNSGSFLRDCIFSIFNKIRLNFEIIIVDNNSTDQSLQLVKEEFNQPNIKILEQSLNKGFATGNNAGAAIAEGKYFHFLNPDTEVTDEINIAYSKVLFSEGNEIFVNKIINPNGSAETSKNLIPLLNNYMFKLFSESKTTYWYTGATLILSREVFDKIGRWSEDYFMYSEDMDIFYKASLKKIRIVELECPVIHHGKGSTSKIWTDYDREMRIQRSFRIFYKINNKLAEYYLIKPIILIYNFLKSPSRGLFMLKVAFKMKSD